MSKTQVIERAAIHPMLRILGACAVGVLFVVPAARGEFLTNNINLGTINDTGSCTRTIFGPGSSSGVVDVRAVATTLAAWGTGMDFASRVRSSNSAIRARITEKRDGFQNRSNRCPFTGSIGIELSPGSTFRGTASSTITVELPLGRTWSFPVRMHANEIRAMEWSVDQMLQPLERCMAANNGRLTNPSNRTLRNKRISIEVPRNFRIDTLACDGVLTSQVDVALNNVPVTAFRRGGYTSLWRFEATGPVLSTSGNHLDTRFNCTDKHRPDACGSLPVRLDWNRIASLQHPSSLSATVEVTFDGRPVGSVHLAISTSTAVSTAPARPPTAGAPVRISRPIGVGGAAPPNVLPQWVSSSTPLLRVQVGARGGNRKVPEGFCSGLDEDVTRVVNVPDLVWGASVVHGDVTVPVQVQLRSGNRTLASFNTQPPLRQNANAQTRTNYPGRPARVQVTNVGRALRSQYGDQTGCFIDRNLPANSPLGQEDQPDLRIVVDTTFQVDEGPTGEADNELPIG